MVAVVTTVGMEALMLQKKSDEHSVHQYQLT
jgi:hypothetical protein